MRSDTMILKDHLRYANSEEFLLTAWGLYQFWKGRMELAGQAVRLNATAVKLRRESRFVIPPWEIVGLLTVYLEAYDNLTDSRLKPKYLDVRAWDTIAGLINIYRDITNRQSMDGIEEDTKSLLEMMPRIMLQQFSWQTGYDAPRFMIRGTFINYCPEARAVFKSRYGLDAETFFTISIALTAHFNRVPHFTNLDMLSSIGIPEADVKKYLNIVSTTVKNASRAAKADGATTRHGLDFKVSRVFDYPIFKIGDDIRFAYTCPFPELLIYRATYFIYFDIMGATVPSTGKRLRKMAFEAKSAMDKRFERYCVELAQHSIPDPILCRGDFTYGQAGFQRHTTDLLIHTGNRISIAAECKSKKMNINVRLSPRPVRDNLEQLDDLAKGVVQIWKFFRDLKGGVVIEGGTLWIAANDFVGALITLEEWADHNPVFTEDCFRRANEINEATMGSDDFVEEADRPPVCIISATEYENMLHEIRPEYLPEYLSGFANYQRDFDAKGFSPLHLKKENPEGKHPLAKKLHEFLPVVPALHQHRLFLGQGA